MALQNSENIQNITIHLETSVNNNFGMVQNEQCFKSLNLLLKRLQQKYYKTVFF